MRVDHSDQRSTEGAAKLTIETGKGGRNYHKAAKVTKKDTPKVNSESEFLAALCIVIDTREQYPFRFEGHRTARGTLALGDYAIAGMEDTVAVERKELGDLLGCLTTGRERFEKELRRARHYKYFAVVVEEPMSMILDGKYRSAMNKDSATQSILTFSVRYRVPFFFARNRGEAEKITVGLLMKAARERWKEYLAVMRGVPARPADDTSFEFEGGA